MRSGRGASATVGAALAVVAMWATACTTTAGFSLAAGSNSETGETSNVEESPPGAQGAQARQGEPVPEPEDGGVDSAAEDAGADTGPGASDGGAEDAGVVDAGACSRFTRFEIPVGTCVCSPAGCVGEKYIQYREQLTDTMCLSNGQNMGANWDFLGLNGVSEPWVIWSTCALSHFTFTSGASVPPGQNRCSATCR